MGAQRPRHVHSQGDGARDDRDGRCRAQPLHPKRLLGTAFQLPFGADGLSPAQRAAWLERRHAGLRGGRGLQRRHARVSAQVDASACLEEYLNYLYDNHEYLQIKTTSSKYLGNIKLSALYTGMFIDEDDTIYEVYSVIDARW